MLQVHVADVAFMSQLPVLQAHFHHLSLIFKFAVMIEGKKAFNALPPLYAFFICPASFTFLYSRALLGFGKIEPAAPGYKQLYSCRGYLL